MTNITDLLLSLDPTLQRHDEGFWNEPYVGKTNFSSFNDAGLECEVGEFLYGLLRVLKPIHVLETGTHVAVGASYMGMALKDNRKGLLETIEFLPEIYDRAVQRIKDLDLELFVSCHKTDARLFDPGDTKYQFVLLDTEPQTRFEELIRYFPSIDIGGYVFIHDLHRHMHQIPNDEHGFAWPFGIIPDQIKEWVKNGELRPMHFTTPRGLTGFYKPSPHDYHWT